MNIRLVSLLLVALIAAGGAVFAANSWLAGQRAALEDARRQQAPVKADHTRIVVAKAALPAGTLIKKAHLRWQAWPDDGVTDIHLVEGRVTLDDISGTVVRAGIAAGEPITEARVVRPGERGFLAAVLRPGFRAVTVAVNTTTGIAGFVFPGDRVDLILSHALGKEDGNGRERKASETVLTDVRVIAIDQSTNDQAEKPSPAKNVTLEVTPKQVEMVTLLTDIGRLSLSLRALQREDGTIVEEDGMAGTVAGAEEGRAVPVATLSPTLVGLLGQSAPERGRGHTMDSEVSRLLEAPRSKADTQTVRVVRGTESLVIEFQRSGK